MINGNSGSWQTIASRIFSNDAGTRYNNPAIESIGQQSRELQATNVQAAGVMQQAIKDLKDHKISHHQAMDIYDELKAAGAGGGAFSTMENIFERASNSRKLDKTEESGFQIAMGLERYGEKALAPLPQLPNVNASSTSSGGQISF